MSTKHILWVAPRHPTKEQILFFRKIINSGRWINFDYVSTVDVNFNFDDYDCVVGTVSIDTLKKVVDEKGFFFKTVAVKYGDKKYRFKGFSKIYKFDYEKVDKLKNGRILSVTRHYFNKSELELLKNVNDGGLPCIRHIKNYINDSDTIISLMEKYNTKDVHWISNVVNYEGLIKKKVYPIRFVGRHEDGSYSDIVRITKEQQIIYNIF